VPSILSEQYRVPVIMLSDEAVAHLRETIRTPGKVEIRDRKKQKGGAPFGTEDDEAFPPWPAFGEGERPIRDRVYP